jgi:hypothetical protein
VIENKGNKKSQIAFMGTSEYRDFLQRQALDRKIKVQVLLERAVEAYLEVGSESGSVARPDSHSRQVELLRYILENGTKNDAAWITGNLKNFAEAIRSRKPGAPEPKGIQEPAELSEDEERLVKEFRTGTLQKRRRMLASVFKIDEPLEPEAMPSRLAKAPVKRAAGK